MRTVYSIGEALIDFIPQQKGVALKEVTHFERVPGGAPANVAAGIARLGGNSAFVGKLGDDAFGHCIVDALKDCGVDTAHIRMTKQAGTALAFVTLAHDGNRDFAFYRNPAADMLLEPSEVDTTAFCERDILHFGSVDLIEAPVKYAHVEAIRAMRAIGGLISFDPNVRLPLWPDAESCRKAILEFLPLADLVKVSDEELPFLTGNSDEAAAVRCLMVGSVKAVIVTRGPNGAVLYVGEKIVEAPGFSVNVVDTTGAGDAFVAAFLYCLAQYDVALERIGEAELHECLTFSNAAAALTTTGYGAIAAMPSLDDVLNRLKC